MRLPSTRPMAALRPDSSISVAPAARTPILGVNGRPSTDTVDRRRLLDRAQELNQRARDAAEQGDVPTAARLILESLDCERRAGGTGPQVLQLIKPR